MSGTIKFLNSNTALGGRVAVGVSSLVGPTGPPGAFGGPQGVQGPGGSGSLTPGTYYGDYLYWNGSDYAVGSNNISLGANSGKKAQGVYNVAIGYQAGFTGGFSSQDIFASTATGSSIAIGNYAGYEQSCNSIAIGNNAGYYQEFNNIAIGSSAGVYQTEINNIAIGIAAGAYDQGTGGSQYSVGGNSIAIGSTVGNNLQGYESVAIGFYAAENKQGYNSIAIGTNAGNQNQGNVSVSMGINAGQTNQGNYSVAIGRNTASSSQGIDSVSVGSYAGNTSQGNNSVALGYYSGYNLQGANSIAIGNASALSNQGINSVSLGAGAGNTSQGNYSIAIGNNAGYTNQPSESIIINASPTGLNASTEGLFINPIRVGSSSQVLYYNTSTKEITYSTGGAFGSTGSIGPTGPAGGGGSSQWLSSTGGIIYYSSGSVGINVPNPTGSLSVRGIVSITGSLNLTGNMNFSTGGNLVNSTFQNYKETVNIASTISSSYIINCNTGNNFQINLTTGTTLSFINVSPTGTLANVNLFLTQDSVGNRTITWPSSVSWGNPSTPVLSTLGGSTDILSFTTFTGGSKWFGFLSGRGF